MSYLVLARKWRPKRFAELVGQEHVVRALSNALDSGRVHHAFLFTGTRGVGKTTIARIFAKSLNCERGASAEPCGECRTCQDIDAGRFIDLLEIDAASNTGVDDVRELIDNAQYMPSRGQVKVYLIDEVHMLSKSAFNALLKTLEEPPAHVKFLLATTDPQKLPVTVLSRCLQFNLKRLDIAQIEGQMRKILNAEGIGFEDAALRQLARAADGSLRDGLSLLDQAIAYSGGEVADAAVAAMLGTVDRSRVGAMLAALAAADGEQLMSEVAALAELSPDWGQVLEALAEALHRIQLQQLVPGVVQEASPGLEVPALAGAIRPELVQLWYQMAIAGRRDLPLAPSPRAGFEMSLLRMLAFRPHSSADALPMPAALAAKPANTVRTSAQAALADVPAKPAAQPAPAPSRAEPMPAVPTPSPMPAAPTPSPMPAAPTPSPTPAPSVPPSPAPILADLDKEQWLKIVPDLALSGPARQLALNAGFVRYAEGVLCLSLTPEQGFLKGPAATRQLADALGGVLGITPKLRFEEAEAATETLQQRQEQEKQARYGTAEQLFGQHPEVQRLIAQGAELVPGSIRPLQE